MNATDEQRRSGTSRWPVPPSSLLVFAAALVARGVAWLQVEVIPRDSIHFLRQAELMLRGDWTGALEWYQQPLFAGLTALVARSACSSAPWPPSPSPRWCATCSGSAPGWRPE